MGRVVWFTGLSGAGKTTIAMAAAERFGCEVLDGDTIRDFFANHDFSREGRERHLLGIAKMAKMISKHTDVLCSFITPYEDVREKILEILPDDALMVHVSTSLEVCEERVAMQHFRNNAQFLLGLGFCLALGLGLGGSADRRPRPLPNACCRALCRARGRQRGAVRRRRVARRRPEVTHRRTPLAPFGVGVRVWWRLKSLRPGQNGRFE